MWRCLQEPITIEAVLLEIPSRTGWQVMPEDYHAWTAYIGLLDMQERAVPLGTGLATKLVVEQEN